LREENFDFVGMGGFHWIIRGEVKELV
jgi:hypothetical protein